MTTDKELICESVRAENIEQDAVGKGGRGTFTCRRCGKVFPLDVESNYGWSLCESCYERFYETCYLCGRHVPKGRLKDGICNTCLLLRGGMTIAPYHIGANCGTIFHATNSKIDLGRPIFFGIELEVGKASTINANRCAYKLFKKYAQKDELFWIERDSSIPDFGFEIITQPLTLDAFRRKREEGVWDAIISELRRYKLKPAQGCGMHVHCGTRTGAMADVLSEEGRYALDYLFSSKKVFFSLISHRASHYAAFHSLNSSNLGKPSGHYNAINFCKRNGTIEFRTFNSTLDIDEIEARLEICDSLIRFCRQLKCAEAKPDAIEWVDFVIKNKKRYKSAMSYIANSIKNYRDKLTNIYSNEY